MKKKICFISPKFSNHIGGMETHAYEFARAFTNNSEYPIDSILIKQIITDGIPAPPREEQDHVLVDNSGREIENSNLKIVLTGDFSKDVKYILAHSSPEDTIYYLNSPTWLPALAEIKKEIPDLRIIVRSGGNDIVAGWIGEESDKSKHLEDSRRQLVELINGHVNYFIVNSEFSRKRTLDLGVDEKKVVKVIGGVDCSLFRPSTEQVNDDVTKIITVARLVEFKGIDDSLKAVKLASEKTKKSLKYLIVGDGPSREKLEDLTNKLDLGRIVEFTGSKRIEDMPHFYKDSDIFLHLPVLLRKYERGSSYIHTETMGRSYCEASASGLPAIGTSVGGVAEIIKAGHSGFLVEESDFVSAAQYLVRLIDNAELRLKMGKNARRLACQKFDWKIIFDQYIALFNEL